MVSGSIILLLPSRNVATDELLPEFGIFALDLGGVEFDAAELLDGFDAGEEGFDLAVGEVADVFDICGWLEGVGGGTGEAYLDSFSCIP